MQIDYPPITGYRWNLIQKIGLATGIDPAGIGTSDNGSATSIHLPVDSLTTAQRAAVDAIMASANPCSPPANTGNTTYRIVDIWSMRQWFIAQIGITPMFWFEEEKANGTGECYMYLQFPRALTTQEKNKLVSTYRNMIGEYSM